MIRLNGISWFANAAVAVDWTWRTNVLNVSLSSMVILMHWVLTKKPIMLSSLGRLRLVIGVPIVASLAPVRR
jgi:hypothetical protein